MDYIKEGTVLTDSILELGDMLFPRYCAVCRSILDKMNITICCACLSSIPLNNFHQVIDNEVMAKFYGRVPLIAATSMTYFEKGSLIQRSIFNLKYHNQKRIGFDLGLFYGLRLKASDLFSDFDVVVPVPLYPRKIRSRGFNQSYVIANGVARALELPVVNIVNRVVVGVSQTLKGRYDRWDSLKGSFVIDPEQRFPFRKVLLVDDVITTGATVESCASAILMLPGVSVGVVSIAYR